MHSRCFPEPMGWIASEYRPKPRFHAIIDVFVLASTGYNLCSTDIRMSLWLRNKNASAPQKHSLHLRNILCHAPRKLDKKNAPIQEAPVEEAPGIFLSGWTSGK